MRRLLLLLALAASVSACDESVEPTLETDRVFTLYGLLDPTAARQSLRVVPITDRIDAPTDAPLNAVITSVESGTGRTAVWRDSLVTFANGERGWVALADGYTPTPGSTVTVTVRAADGREARAAVAVPALVRPSVEAANTLATVTANVSPAQLASAGVVVRATGISGTDTTTLVLPASFRRTPGGYTVPFVEVAQAALQAAGATGRARLVDVRARVFVTGPGWSIPEGGYDPETIVEPGVLTNVAGGFGFVGGGYVVEVPWMPSFSAQAAAGFAVSADPASVLRVNEVALGPAGTAWVELYNPSSDGVQLSSGYRLASGRPGDPELTLPGFIRIEPRQYAAFDVPFAIAPGVSVELRTAAGARVSEYQARATVAGGTSGLFPDGRSFPLTQRGGRPVDRFAAPLVPTRGAANRLALTPAVANEVFTAGLDGFVEVVETDPGRFVVSSVRVATLPDGAAPGGVEAEPAGTGRWLAAEVRSGDPRAALRLEQTGGEVAVFVTVTDTQTGFSGTFPVDVRTFGVQALDRSVGYLPDGPLGAWRSGLRPTPGAPNALD